MTSRASNRSFACTLQRNLDTILKLKLLSLSAETPILSKFLTAPPEYVCEMKKQVFEEHRKLVREFMNILLTTGYVVIVDDIAVCEL